MNERADAAVGRSFLKLGAGEAVARIIAFAATVYLARLLGPGMYGVIVLALAVLLYATCVTDCGVDMLGVRDVADEPQRLGVLLPGYLGARLFVALALILLLNIVGLVDFPQPDGTVLAVYSFLLLPLALGTRWVHLGLEQSGTAGLARVVSEGLAALLLLLLVRGPGDVARAPLAQLLGETVGAILLLGRLPRVTISLSALLGVDAARALLKRSWPIVAHTLFGLLIFNSDFFFLRIYRGSATVGYYAVAYALVSFFLNLGGSYEMSLLPAMTRSGRQPEEQRKLFGSALAQAFAGAFPIAVGGCLVAGALVVLIFGPRYAASETPLQILIWCIPVALFRNVAQTTLVAHGRQRQMLQAAAVAAGLNTLLNAATIPFWGMVGAASSTLLTELIRTALALRFSRLAGLRLPSFQRFWKPLLAGGAMALVVALLESGQVWLSVVAGGAVYFLTLWLLRGMKLQRNGLPELTV